jgi:hypothetical protein
MATETALARGSFGDLIALLQTGLARLGHYTRTVDGDFGGGTDRAVRSLQADKGWAQDGRADADTWQAATGLPWPQLFDRCLQLTARFEGHGYRLIAGNFDGAGLTWGVIGFTLKHGEIQAIVNEVAMRDSSLLQAAFGGRAPELLQQFRQPPAKLMKWADSISEGANKQTVIEPWRSGFATLGAQPLVQEIQRRRAREKYFEPATSTATRLGMTNERGIALCFDIHVQNGGVKSATETAYRSALNGPGAPKTPTDQRALLARLVADSASKKYRGDVFARKSAIATGQGVVHQALFVMDNWALAPD